MTTVAVIEDELPLCEEITDTLTFEGYTVLAAHDGRSGLELALATLPDLIICDINMPQMDGYTLLTELRKHPQMAATPVMFLTARADRTSMRQGMTLGADDYLTKPFTRDEIISAVESRLNRQTMISDQFTRQMEEVKATITRLVAQELRSPLVSMRLIADIVERQVNHVAFPLLDELVSSSVEGLNHVVSQMVYLANLETGMLRRESIMTNGVVTTIDVVLQRAVELAREFTQACRTCEIRVHAQSESANIVAHTQALKHALAELIAEALDTVRPGETLNISQWQSHGSVWLSLMYREFEKAPGNLNAIPIDKQTDPGLGMLVARGIIEAHGGMVGIQVVPTQGIQITVQIPLLQNS